MTRPADEIKNLGVIVEYANPDAWRVIIAGRLVGFALRMSGGGWCAFDAEDSRLAGVKHKRPMAVGKWILAEVQAGRIDITAAAPTTLQALASQENEE